MKLIAVLPAAVLVLALVPPACRAATATPPPPLKASSTITPAADAAPAAAGIVPAGDTFSAAREALLRAVYESTDSITAARARLEALATADPRSAERHYWVALADYRLAPRVMKDPKLGARYCEDGLHHAEAAVKLAPKFADALALKAGLEGFSISIEPSRAMVVSGQISEDLGQAKALAPKNPRVALFDGINTYHMPKFVGGGPDKALPKLKKAQALFAAETPAPTRSRGARTTRSCGRDARASSSRSTTKRARSIARRSTPIRRTCG